LKNLLIRPASGEGPNLVMIGVISGQESVNRENIGFG
jgi:hypothetical protein